MMSRPEEEFMRSRQFISPNIAQAGLKASFLDTVLGAPTPFSIGGGMANEAMPSQNVKRISHVVTSRGHSFLSRNIGFAGRKAVV